MVSRFRYLAEKNKGKNIIYLIEEPETFLHPSAQEDLLNSFLDLAEENQIIISTHSPVFAGATRKDSIILCKKKIESTYISSFNNPDLINNIVEELGIKPSFNLRDYHEKIIFVESKNDREFYNMIAEKLLHKSLIGNRKILILPFGGGEDIDSFINIDYFDKSGRDLYLIIDSDKHNHDEGRQNLRAISFAKKDKGMSYVLQKSCIENYYHPRAIERYCNVAKDSVNYFTDDDDVNTKIKEIVMNNSIKTNLKRKNNFDIFNLMTVDEWREVVEQDLINFLDKIVSD